MKAYTEHAAVNKGSQCFVLFFPLLFWFLVLCYSYKKDLNFVLFCFFTYNSNWFPGFRYTSAWLYLLSATNCKGYINNTNEVFGLRRQLSSLF